MPVLVKLLPGTWRAENGRPMRPYATGRDALNFFTTGLSQKTSGLQGPLIQPPCFLLWGPLKGNARPLLRFMRPDSILELYTMCGPKYPNFNKFYVSNVRQIATFMPFFIFKLNEVEVCFSEIHTCVCLWENTNSMEQSPSWEAMSTLSLSRNFPHFMEREGSSPCSQELATCPYPEPSESNPHPKTLFPQDPS
jgi:hypothetical protein